MALPENGEFTDVAATRRFLMRLVGERFAGFIDFDSQGQRRRLFFDEGRVFNTQSAVPGEAITDVLLQQKRLNAEQQRAALQLSRDKKLPLEQALIELGALSEGQALRAIEDACELVVRSLANAPSTSFKLTQKPGLRARMLGRLVELVPLLSVQDESLRDPNVKERTDPSAGPRAEIRRVHGKLAQATYYEVLEAKPDASVDELRKRYFEMAKRWHADMYQGFSLGEDKILLDEIFALVGDAWATLSDPAKRADYDAVLDRKSKGLPTDMQEILNAEALFKKGEALLTRGEAVAALRELEEAKRINPGEAEFWAVYALASYMAKHEAKPAIAAAQKALALSPNLARTHEILGRIYRGENENRHARQHFEKCLELDPRNINAQRELRLMTMRRESDKHAALKREQGGLLSKLFKK